MDGLMVPAVLLAMAESFAGQKLAVDERLLLPLCPAPAMSWAGAAAGLPGRVEVRCDQPAWRVFLPVLKDAGAGETGRETGAGRVRMVYEGKNLEESEALPVRQFRRGETVMVGMQGRGFAVSLEAVAEGPAREGRLWVKAASGDGRRFLARLGEDGNLMIDGLSGVVKRR